MQWRLLVRKDPLRSFTIVGDVAQVASAAGTGDWATALGPVFKDAWRLEELTVNYRTPAQITAVAERMAAANGVPVTPTRAVREGDWPVEVIRVAVPERAHSRVAERAERGEAAEREALAESIVEAIERVRESDAGTLAVIATPATADSIQLRLTEALGRDVIGRGALGLRRQVALLTPQDAKGLEFDAVVVVEPADIIADGPRGAGALYVSMTRPTQRLVLVAAKPLPAGIDLP